MSTEKRQFPQGEFLRQFNLTGRIDRKNSARVFNEASDPYFQKGIREQRLGELARVLEDARSQPKPELPQTAIDTLPILERTAEIGRQYKAEQAKKSMDSTISPEKKQAVTEIHDILNQKSERISLLTGNLMGIYMRFPENQRELVSQAVWQLVDQQLNQMSDQGHTQDAVNLIDDKEGMLRLRIQKAQELFDKLQGQTEKQDGTDKDAPAKEADGLSPDIDPDKGGENGVDRDEIDKDEDKDERKKETDDKRSKEKPAGRIKRGLRALKNGLKAAWKNPFVKYPIIIGATAGITYLTAGSLLHYGIVPWSIFKDINLYPEIINYLPR